MFIPKALKVDQTVTNTEELFNMRGTWTVGHKFLIGKVTTYDQIPPQHYYDLVDSAGSKIGGVHFSKVKAV